MQIFNKMFALTILKSCSLKIIVKNGPFVNVYFCTYRPYIILSIMYRNKYIFFFLRD